MGNKISVFGVKKIIILFITTLVITSCLGKTQEEKIEVEISTNQLEDLVNNQKFDEAIPELENRYNDNSEEIGNILNYMSALLAKGSITRQEKEYSEKAIIVGNKALLIFPNNSELYRHIGYAYEISENYEESFKAYDKSIELDSNNALAYSNRGHAYKLSGDYSKAEIDFLKAYKLDKTNDFVLINLGWLNHIQFYELDEALQYYNEAIDITKNIRFKSEAYHSTGYIYIGIGDYEKAEKAFINGIKSDEKFELGYLGLSEVQMLTLIYRSKDKTEEEKAKLLEDALKNNEIAITLNPTKAIAYFKKGLILKDIEEFKDESQLMFKLALDAIEIDITLGQKEKENLKNHIITNFKKDEQK